MSECPNLLSTDPVCQCSDCMNHRFQDELGPVIEDKLVCPNFGSGILCDCSECLHKRYVECLIHWHEGTYNQYRKDKKRSISLDEAVSKLKSFLKET